MAFKKKYTNFRIIQVKFKSNEICYSCIVSILSIYRQCTGEDISQGYVGKYQNNVFFHDVTGEC